MSAIYRLVRLLETGRLTCVGPKHFPASEYLKPRGWAQLIASELAKPARAKDMGALRAIIRELDKTKERCGNRFKIGVFRRSFIRVAEEVESAAGVKGVSRGFAALVVRILTRESGSGRQNRIKKMPQLENVLRFLRSIVRLSKRRAGQGGRSRG